MYVGKDTAVVVDVTAPAVVVVGACEAVVVAATVLVAAAEVVHTAVVVDVTAPTRHAEEQGPAGTAGGSGMDPFVVVGVAGARVVVLCSMTVTSVSMPSE